MARQARRNEPVTLPEQLEAARQILGEVRQNTEETARELDRLKTMAVTASSMVSSLPDADVTITYDREAFDRIRETQQQQYPPSNIFPADEASILEEKKEPEVPFWPAPEVEETARFIIEQYHDHLIMNGVRVLYLFREEMEKVGGRLCWATARKVGGLNAFLSQLLENQANGMSAKFEADPFFVISVHHRTWNVLTIEQRAALVDHELCHCLSGRDDEGKLKLSMRGHDVEEFADIIERWGSWTPSLSEIKRLLDKHESLSCSATSLETKA